MTHFFWPVHPYNKELFQVWIKMINHLDFDNQSVVVKEDKVAWLWGTIEINLFVCYESLKRVFRSATIFELPGAIDPVRSYWIHVCSCTGKCSVCKIGLVGLSKKIEMSGVLFFRTTSFFFVQECLSHHVLLVSISLRQTKWINAQWSLF